MKKDPIPQNAPTRFKIILEKMPNSKIEAKFLVEKLFTGGKIHLHNSLVKFSKALIIFILLLLPSAKSKIILFLHLSSIHINADKISLKRKTQFHNSL